MDVQLGLWQEMVGTIVGVEQRGGTVVVTFRHGVGVVVPGDALQSITQLRTAVGKRGSILRTDVPAREYLVRKEGGEDE